MTLQALFRGLCENLTKLCTRLFQCVSCLSNIEDPQWESRTKPSPHISKTRHVMGMNFSFWQSNPKAATLCQTTVMLFIIKAQRGIKFGKLCSCTEISQDRGREHILFAWHCLIAPSLVINHCLWIYLSACSMWCTVQLSRERRAQTVPGLVPLLPPHIILTTLDESLGQMACEHVRVSVWVRAAVLTKIITAGASKVTSHVFS